MKRRDEFGPAGAVLADGDSATLVFRRRLPHPPEAVWKALTEPAELSLVHDQGEGGRARRGLDRVRIGPFPPAGDRPHPHLGPAQDSRARMEGSAAGGASLWGRRRDKVGA